MTVHGLTQDELEQMSFDSGVPYEPHAHGTAWLRLGDDLYVSRVAS